MNPAPSGGHAQIDQQLAELLGERVRRTGLTATGPFNLGQDERDYRVPDRGLHGRFSDQVFYATAALVVEIVSPGDESYQKLDFYADRGVDEVVIVDRGRRQVDWLGLNRGNYEQIDHSKVVGLGPTALAERIDWP